MRSLRHNVRLSLLILFSSSVDARRGGIEFSRGDGRHTIGAICTPRFLSHPSTAHTSQRARNASTSNRCELPHARRRSLETKRANAARKQVQQMLHCGRDKQLDTMRSEIYL